MIKQLFNGLNPLTARDDAGSAGKPPADAMKPSARMTLADALRGDWLEFWYQPKIDLQLRRAVGAEMFARVRHPELGLLQPGKFLAGADEKSLTALNQRALISALHAGSSFAKLGVNLRVAINVTLNTLLELPVSEIVRQHRPSANSWPGLIFDVNESQLIVDRPLLHEFLTEIDRCGIKLAIDDFGGGQLPLSRLKGLPFCELKLDRTFVMDCGVNPDDASICKSIVDLAHNFGRTAVAIGVEKAADFKTLHAMGCDVAQGYLLGQPMPLDEFLTLLKARSVKSAKPAVAPRPAHSG